MPALLAIDVGLKTGLALYGEDGRLQWYGSHNFGTTARLRRGGRHVLHHMPHLAWLILEGGGMLADIWTREAGRRGIAVYQISAEVWRRQLLYRREQQSGRQAKNSAGNLAREVIAWSHIRRPATLRDDTAEAILIGLWGSLEVGWLAHLPAVLQR